MGREARRVPKGWKHPKRKDGSYIPLLDDNYEADLERYNKNNELWLKGEHPSQKEYPEDTASINNYGEWDGGPPDPESYVQYPKSEKRTHSQMYENCTEGCPISPVMETPEKLARWLVDNDHAHEGYTPWTYESWLSTIKVTCDTGWEEQWKHRSSFI